MKIMAMGAPYHIQFGNKSQAAKKGIAAIETVADAKLARINAGKNREAVETMQALRHSMENQGRVPVPSTPWDGRGTANRVRPTFNNERPIKPSQAQLPAEEVSGHQNFRTVDPDVR